MKTVLLTCEALEPLVLTDGSAESMAHECLGYIPGNMLLGAMAVVWKQLHRGQNPDESPQFSRLFLSGDVAWGHALPACAPGPAMPIPASYRHDKDHDALPPEGEAFEPGEYWVANILTLRDGPEPPSPWQNAAASRKLRRLGQGFMNPATLHRLVERRVFNIHVALGEQRCARDGQLYGYSALARGTRLISRILCRSAAAAEELLNLARDVNALRVGHARSAGYGRIAVQWQDREAATQSGAAEKTFLLFLESQFMPTPSWADCQASLCREIGRLAGQEPRITAFYGSQEEIQGYNGFWNRPRTSRTCLAMGNVIRIEFEAPVALPPAFCIGAAQLEGYGRILVNPPFLMSAEPAIVPLLPAKPEQAREASPASLSIWPLLRERIISRQMREQVSLWLNEPAWHNFLEDVKKFEKPTASQRNNLRDMGVAAFREMLGKTPGEQWKQAVARCPFTGRRDHLSEIMLKLLDPDIFCKTWRFTPSDLPGQPESADAAKAQRLFVRQLVSTWNKLSRLSSDKE